MLRFLALSALVAVVCASPKVYTPTRDVSSPCASAVVASNSTAVVGDNVVLLEVLTCAAGSTKGPVANVNIGQAIENLLCHIIPIFCPPKPFNPEAQPTRTVTQTVVRTSEVPTTIIETATATFTEVDTVTFATTAIETATATLIETETDTATFATTLIDETTLIVPTTIVQLSTVLQQTTVDVVVTASAPTPTAAPAATNVCNELCAVTCSSLGVLPPDSNDCAVVRESIQVFQSTTGPTFVVQPNHVQQLSFGTCRFFFENLGTTPLEACWSDLSSQGSLASTECFPPVQPVMSLAVCEARDTTWEIGVSHS